MLVQTLFGIRIRYIYFNTVGYFSYASPNEKIQFPNRYNYCSDKVFRVQFTKLPILSGVLFFTIYIKTLLNAQFRLQIFLLGLA
jgi:hypothetical protein